MAAVFALLVAACWPLGQVFTSGWVRPVLASVLAALGIAWLCRLIGLGPVLAFVASVAGWLWFTGLAFAGDAMFAGLIPTPSTPVAVMHLWARGIELIRVTPSPAFPEAPLLVITVTAVWAVAYTVECMVFRLAAPLQAVVMALVLWVSPLVITTTRGYVWILAVPFLAASAWLLLTCSGGDLVRWGAVADPVRLRGGAGGSVGQRPSHALRGAGWTVATAAIALGVVLGGLLPGARSPAWLDLAGLSGTTNTSNPIVNIKARLVAQNTGPVLRTRSPRPIYLRITSLDVYDPAREEWTSAGIRGAPVQGPLPSLDPIGAAEEIDVEVTVAGIEPDAILVPAPYQPVEVSGPASETFQYDPQVATLTLDRGRTLRSGDQYHVLAAIPNPPAELLNTLAANPADPDAVPPPNVPPEVAQLARDIVDREGAVTVFEQALAIQDELRTWTYSLEPAPGHSASAMLSFIETREGYCEQFAGTMAVMLRTLGIPSRVAVGYSPGVLSEDGQYVITNENAHAWVEVHFPGFGWVAFEPTPRSDGNVLVPTATNLAPRLTERDTPGSRVANDGLSPGEEQRLQREGAASEPPAEAPLLPLPGIGGQAPWPIRLVLLGLGVAVLVGAGVLVALRLRGRRAVLAPPAQRTLRARARVGRLGRGLGIRPTASETDREYLHRLAGTTEAADRLARATEAARYAPAMPPDQADDAESAADEVSERLLRTQPRWKRGLVVAGIPTRRRGRGGPGGRLGTRPSDRVSTRPTTTRPSDDPRRTGAIRP